MKTCPTCQQTYSDDVEFCPRDGAQLTAQATETEAQLAGQLSRRFRLVRRLGAGGMGAVFLAEQIGVGNRPVALKVLNRKLLDDPDFLLRFQNEAASTGRIHHPNVVTIHESGQADDGTPYIAMEFLEGESLRQALARRGQLPVPEVAEILQQAARGLNAAHKLGIIHRDLKPDNIFLTYPDDVGAGLVPALPVGIADTGRPQEPPLPPVVVKLVDFGIAKLRESATHTQTGMVLGTPAYMSFEQASGMRSDELDARSDVYSLGVVVYEMLTGRTPFHSDTPVGYLRMHMQETPPPFRAVKPDLPALPQLERVVMKALTKDRDQRYGSVLEFARAFAEAAVPAPGTVGAVREPPLRDQSTQLQPPSPPPARPALLVVTGAAPKGPRLAVWVGVAVAALVLGLGGWHLASIFLHTGSTTPPLARSIGTVWENSKDRLKYLWIPPGTFMMGCSPGDTECSDDEKPAHLVTISKGFWMGQTPVTAAAFKRYARATGKAMPTPPDFNAGWNNQDMPIVNVSWDDSTAFCGWAGGRLPTEAEWEYAARAGSTASRYGPIDDVAWHKSNSGGGSHEVAQKRANVFGLYDMLGNVWEWVNDWYGEDFYQFLMKQSPTMPPLPPGSSVLDPQGPESGQSRVVRGGSWWELPTDIRVSRRFRTVPDNIIYDFGLRCVREGASR
jgi:serine/threonine-protein kinase